MSDYLETGDNNPQTNRHLLGLLAGIGTGIVVGLILAGVGILIKSESTFVVLLGLMLVGFVVSRLVPNKSAMGIITGGLSCIITFFAYQLFLNMFGYSYEDNSSFWIMLAVAAVYGGYMGYKGKKEFESKE